MNGYKVSGYILIFLVAYEMIKIIGDYYSGKLGFWPFGAEIGAGLTIALGIYLIKKGNKHSKKL
jgi:hypothetical protein